MNQQAMKMRRCEWSPRADHVSSTPTRWLAIFVAVSGCCLFTACEDSNRPATSSLAEIESGEIQILYPLDQTVFPPEIVAPTWRWQDPTDEAVRWKIEAGIRDPSTGGPFETFSSNPFWRPSAEQWSAFKEQSVSREAEVHIVGLNASGDPVSSARQIIRTSEDPVGDALFYREVPLPFIEAVQDPAQIRWRFGSIDSETAPPIVLENLPVCGNCHSFSGDGSLLGLDVDYGNDKGGYAVLPVSEQMVMNDEKIITWSDYQREDGEATFGLLSQVSPDGRYVISTVKDRAVFVATPEIAFSQLFFPIKGILVVYDTETGHYSPLPGADDPEYVQSNPTWSPDGKTVVFARAKAYRKESIEGAPGILLNENDVPEFIEDREPFKFDLYQVPFNDGQGGQAKPLLGASHNGMSNFFAKFSPDGRWIIFCKAENYMLLMPDSELYIIPAEGGDPRRLRANTPLMNSWHSWSSNSRWLVFSSKANTPYTQLFLTHINEAGESTPPVVLDRFTAKDRAANIPEFVPLRADAIAKIQEEFLDAYSFLRAGMANERTGDYPGAIRAYRRGLEAEPENPELLNSLGFSLFQLGRSEEAVEALEEALEADPSHWKAHNNLALASVDLGELELAEAHYRESLSLRPQPAIYNDLGFVLERLGMADEGQAMYRRSLELDPQSAGAHYNLAASLARRGDDIESEAHFRQALAQTSSPQAHIGISVVLQRQGKTDEAIKHLNDAIQIDPSQVIAYEQLGDLLQAEGRFQEAAEQYRAADRLQPSASVRQKLSSALSQSQRASKSTPEGARWDQHTPSANRL
ncbi:MAG: tetratricopeptide repeat protein [Myxococcota bacterium]|nr:tetratricopeptide repeat protein [Myxococcota bacterium]